MPLANSPGEGTSLLDELTNLVKISSVFQHISENDELLAELASLCSFRYFKDGDIITRDGNHSLFFIIKGTVRIQAEKTILSEICAPDFCLSF